MKQFTTLLLLLLLTQATAQNLLPIPASSFLDEVPKGNVITTAGEQRVEVTQEGTFETKRYAGDPLFYDGLPPND
jgi:hypothetical protein